ncbi:unnamed protein product [Aphanomyces euteiches]
MDDLVAILKRELDEFMATHASTVLAKIEDDAMDSVCLAEVRRIGSMWAVMATRNFGFTVETILQWQSARLDGSVFGRVGLWLTGNVLQTILDRPLPTTPTKAWESLVECAFKVLAEWNQVESCFTTDAPSFFTFKTVKPIKPTNDFLLQEAVHAVWKDNLGLMGRCAIDSIKQHVVDDPERASSGITKETFLNNLSAIRFRLLRPDALFDKQAQATTSFLRVLVSYTHKAQRHSLRLAALQVLGTILSRELNGLSVDGVRAYHDVIHADDWIALVQDFHTSVCKLSENKRFAVVAWQVRLCLLLLSSKEQFSQWWKDDATALMDVFNRQKGSIPFLHLVDLFLCHLVQRHLATGRRLPAATDMMEIINSIQAWCFTNSKHKVKKMRAIFAALSRISQSIATYNMDYAVENHIHHLIVDSESIFQVRQLVGLLSLQRLFQETGLLGAAAAVNLDLDSSALVAHCSTLGAVVGNVLVDCSGHFESSKRPAKTSDNNRWLGLQTFEAAIECTQVLFRHMELHFDQKLLILARCAVHNDGNLRATAAKAIKRIAIALEDTTVIRYLVEFLLRPEQSEAETALMLDELHSILLEPDLPRIQSLDGDLGPAEALALFFLCHNSHRIRQQALHLLECVRNIRKVGLKSPTINAMDVVTGIDGDLQTKFGLQPDEKESALHAGGVFHWLVLQSPPKEWLWSMSLSMLFPRVCEICPSVVDHVWSSAVDLIHQIEPDFHGTDGDDGKDSASQWRNLSILACATGIGERLEATRTLLQRQCKYLASPWLGQRISAVLAVSSTHYSVYMPLLDVLGTFQAEAFDDVSRYKGPHVASLQLALQWALSRCFRALVEHRIQMWSDSQFRQHVLRFVDKVYAALTAPRTSDGATSMMWTWWIRFEFCCIVESIVHQNNMVHLLDEDEMLVVQPSTREKWFLAALQWCSTRPQVFTAKQTTASMLLPCSRVDAQAPWQQYLLTKRAYSAMAMLLIGPPFNLSSCFSWIDACFALPNAVELQAIVASGLRLLVQSEHAAIIPQCVDRCYYHDPAASQVAKQYLDVVASVLVDLIDEFQRSSSLCGLIFAALLHLHQRDNHAAIHILTALTDDSAKAAYLVETKTTPRHTQFLLCQIAPKWKERSLDVLQLMISFVAKCSTPHLQAHILSLSPSWAQQLSSMDRSLLTHLFRLTHDNLQLAALNTLWLELSRCHDYRHVRVLVEFFFSLATREKLQTATHVFKWITPSSVDVQQILGEIMRQAQAETTFATSCLAVTFLATLSFHMDDHVGAVASRWAFNILFTTLRDKSTLDEMFATIEEDCMSIIEAMIDRDALGYDSLLGMLRNYLASSSSGPDDDSTGRPTVDEYEAFLESFCLSLTPERQDAWTRTSIASILSAAHDASFCLLSYRLLRPPFDGTFCLQLTARLTAALDDPDAAPMVHEYLLTLTEMAASMPPNKLVLFPRLLWTTVSLLNDRGGSNQVTALCLLHQLVSKPTFQEPIMQDLLAAQSPSSSRDVTLEILVAVCRHLNSLESEPQVVAIVRCLLGSNVETKLHCVMYTAILLPQLVAKRMEPSKTLDARQELSYLWRLQQQHALARCFLDEMQSPWKLAPLAVGKLIMASLASPDEEKMFFDVLLGILNGQCTNLIAPTIELLHGLLQAAAPPLFWKRNAMLLATLTRILRSTDANDTSWPVLVSLLSTLMPCP